MGRKPAYLWINSGHCKQQREALDWRLYMSLFMTPSKIFIFQEEFRLFHAIDRELYALLVNDLWRDPLESMQIMALWLWLEKSGFRNVIKKILSLPHILINEVADEAVICLNCINNARFVLSDELNDIPLTQNLMEKEISLQIFHENRLIAAQGLAKIVTEVCGKALKDIMQLAMKRNGATNQQSFVQPGFSQLGFVGGGDMAEGDVAPDDRTMFVTFSKGYPVSGREVKEFFNRAFGDCIESLCMQEVKPTEQALFARIVFYSLSTIELILNGVEKAKFTINGKHVWVRKFVPRRPTATTL